MRKEFSAVLSALVGRSREEPGAVRALGPWGCRKTEEWVGAASGSFQVREGGARRPAPSPEPGHGRVSSAGDCAAQMHID